MKHNAKTFSLLPLFGLAISLTVSSYAQKIQVISASYGSRNCGTPAGNVTAPVAGICDGQSDCNVFVDNRVFGDPAFGCPKDFTAQWTCGGTGIRTASHDPVANEGYTVSLSCECSVDVMPERQDTLAWASKTYDHSDTDGKGKATIERRVCPYFPLDGSQYGRRQQ